MDRFWLKSYPENVPHDIDVNKFASVPAILAHACKKFPDKPAYTNFGTTITFADVDKLSRTLGHYLQNTLGLNKGDRIAIMLPNVLQYPIALFAAMRVGLTIVNIDPLYTKPELVHQLNDSGAETLLFLENFGDTVAAALPETSVKKCICTRVGDCLSFPTSLIINSVLRYVKKAVPTFHIDNLHHFKSAMSKANASSCQDETLNHDDILFLQYTGGTTGVSKGAVLTHRNLVANMLQAGSWIGDNLSPGDTIIAALPIYHIFSMTANILTMMEIGCHNLLITNPRDFAGFVKILKKSNFNAFIGVNTLYRKLMDTKGFDELDFSKLKLSFAGGMSVTRDVADDWKAITNLPVVEAYGLTETSPAATMNPLDMKEYNGFIGLPISSTYVQVKDAEGNNLGKNVEGELCIKGPQVTQGYWNRPEETKNAFTEDEYFRTGDYAMINEEGYVKILDRKKDMILVSGFNVFPNQVEDVLCQHPKILEAAVIGMPDSVTGEAVKAFVVKSDESLNEEEIKAHCKENLTGYKRPKEILFIDELPKSNVGKILRKKLR
jgi:long-chain acyl-CoA synthetase